MPAAGLSGASRLPVRELALLAATVFLGTAAAEGVLRLVHPTPREYRALPPGLETRFERNLPAGVQGPSTYRVNSMGVRGREWAGTARAERRLLCLGGSTTECLVTDEARVWTARLEALLAGAGSGRPVWVGNAGRSGLTSRHHVLQMRELLAVYEPETVVVLAGVNDLSRRLSQDGAYDPRFLETPDGVEWTARQAFAVAPGRFAAEWPHDPWWKRTRLWLLLRRLKYPGVVPDEQDQEGRYLKRWRELRAAGPRTATLPELASGLDEFERNLREIVGLGRDRAVSVVLATQPVLWRADLRPEEEATLWMGGIGEFRSRPGSTYYEAGALARAMDAYNERTRTVARETGARLADLAAAVPRTNEYFWDDCHFTDRAQEVVAEVVAKALGASSPP